MSTLPGVRIRWGQYLFSLLRLLYDSVIIMGLPGSQTPFHGCGSADRTLYHAHSLHRGSIGVDSTPLSKPMRASIAQPLQRPLLNAVND
jgi:hypothetical protein